MYHKSPTLNRHLVLSAIMLLAIGAVSVLAWHILKEMKHNENAIGIAKPVLEIFLDSSTDLYANRVRPLLQKRCCRCHGDKRHHGGLRVDTVMAMLKGGDSGPAVVPGKSSDSLLINRVVSHEMPEGGPPLTGEQIQELRQWIDHGALGPAGGEAAASYRLHWSFGPLRAPAVPKPSNATYVVNPIDAFIAAAREKGGLKRHNPPADKRLLLRRLFIDLTGLPPSKEDYDEYLQDSSPNAYEKAVDRLLSSPRYGERWARHWMDIWRYSSADGREAIKEITYGSKHIWRWRDYLIESLNNDKGLNTIIMEMLAGDEIAPGDPRVLAATGYLVRNYNMLDREQWLINTVDHTSRSFLGLTLGCARCHNHKFDPLSQKEYYQVRAFFEYHRVQTDDKQELAYARDLGGNPTYLYVRGDPRTPDKSVTIQPGVPEVLGRIGPAELIETKVDGKSYRSSGKRLAFAKWLVDDHNPLVARVAVNHVWLRHFGKGLVDTPAEFGTRGKPPTHPELLDWLALQFRAEKWSMKWLHRLIATSNTYRMSSTNLGMADCVKIDQSNAFYWRGNPRRAEAEVVRDAILRLADKLDEQVGGPDDKGPAETSARRSLYLRASRNSRVAFLDVFDAASVDECYQRTESVIPQQGLALLNSELVWHCAHEIAERLTVSPDFVGSAMELILGREPNPEEVAVCRRFLEDQERLLTSTGASNSARLARTYLVHGLLNHNDFVTIR